MMELHGSNPPNPFSTTIKSLKKNKTKKNQIKLYYLNQAGQMCNKGMQVITLLAKFPVNPYLYS